MSESRAISLPLGMPRGSVRAILTLSILGTVWFLMFRDRILHDDLQQALMMVLGYYFAMRKRDDSPPTSGVEPPPLGLPSGSIRTLIVLGFVGIGYVLYREQRLLSSKALPVLILFGGFFLGYFLRFLRIRWEKWSENIVVAWWGHIKALATIGVTLAYCIVVALGKPSLLPSQTSSVFLGLLGYYFGSR